MTLLATNAAPTNATARLPGLLRLLAGRLVAKPSASDAERLLADLARAEAARDAANRILR